METPAKKLIQAVERERLQRQMDDRRFSREVLGISPPYYCLLKSGKRRITLEVLQILMQKLPEVTQEVTIYFWSQGDDGKNKKGLDKSRGRNLPGLPRTRKRGNTPQKT